MSAQLTAADVLERAADLIAKPGAWTQGTYAADAYDLSVETDSPKATCWCAMGAIWKVADGDPDLEDRSANLLGSLVGLIQDWNDDADRTQSEVVAKLREAAALARSEASQ